MCDRGCAGNFAKCLVVTFNTICILLGMMCLGVGIWAYVDSQSLAGVLGNIPQDNDRSATEAVDAPSLLERGQWALIVGGALTIIISIIGCIGACKENKPMLIFFVIIVIIIILIELAAAVLVIFFRDTVDDVLKDHLFDTMDEYEQGIILGSHKITESSDDIEQGWDVSQVTLECCGVDGYMDWINATNFNAEYDGEFCHERIINPDPVVPLSCCKTTNPHRYPAALDELFFVNITGCLSDPTEANANLGGCYEAILDQMELYSLILIIICLIVGILEIGVVIAGCYLICRVKGKRVD